LHGFFIGGINMKEQMQAAMESMSQWLSHPGELGKKPSKIECMKEFNLHDRHYYVFRYKKGLFGDWLLGVCGGYEEGETEAIRRMLMFLESQMTDNKRCKCDRLTRSKFYPYCPYCGEKYE
jgi:hypothetical protein